MIELNLKPLLVRTAFVWFTMNTLFAGVVRLEDFQTDERPNTINGEKGGRAAIEIATSSSDRRPAIRLNYDFTAAADSRQVYAGVELGLKKIEREITQLDFSIQGDLSNHSLTIQLCDANGTWFGFAVTPAQLNLSQRQNYKADLTQRPLYYWHNAGKTDKPRIIFPITRIRIIVNYSNLKGPKQGSLLISGLDATTNSVPVNIVSRSSFYSAREPAPQVSRPAEAVHSHAHFDLRNGIVSMTVDDAPFFILGAQCDVWRNTRRDKKTVEFFDAYQKMNATAVGADILWSQLEPEKDRYDFSFLEWYMRQAEARNLKLVLQLFFSNVCGKTNEPGGYPQYAPDYILKHPETYTRLTVNTDGQPQLCPNNPALLEREIKMVRRLAEYLKNNDSLRTVIMVQLDNEVGMDLMQRNQICQCSRCLKLRQDKCYPVSDNLFMAYSFAHYLRRIADEFAGVYDLPLYLNSPGWNSRVDEILLANSPNLDLIGADAIYDPQQPLHTMSSRYLQKRNIAFCAEQPTAQFAETKLNLDILPWHSLLKHNGIGGLIWEAGEPHTVVYDPAAAKRFGDALYPLKNAMVPLAAAQGSNRLSGWFCEDRNKQAFFLRENGEERHVRGAEFELRAGNWQFKIKDSVGGMILAEPDSAIIATGKAIIAVPERTAIIKSEIGHFSGMRWIREADLPVERRHGWYYWDIKPHQVVKIYRNLKEPAMTPPAPAFLELKVFANHEICRESTTASTVKVCAITDLAATRLALITPAGWNAEPAYYDLPALKKGAVIEKPFHFTAPKGTSSNNAFRLAARLTDGGQTLAESGLPLHTEPAVEVGLGDARFSPDSEGKLVVSVHLINRRSTDLSGKITWSGRSLAQEEETAFTIEKLSQKTIPVSIKISSEYPAQVIGTVVLDEKTYVLTPEIIIPKIDLVQSPWRFMLDGERKGETQGWLLPDYNDSSWTVVKVPEYWMPQGIKQQGANGKPQPILGEGWYRVSFVVPESCRNKSLRLLIGAIDDFDMTWFNGRLIGQTGPSVVNAWQDERYYAIPNSVVRYGRPNTIVVKVSNTLGDGGIWQAPATIVITNMTKN